MSKLNRFSPLTALAALALCLAPVVTQDAHADGSKGTLTSRDYKFVSTALEAGTTEITVGHIATQNGGDQSVRDLGQHMVDDHQKANDELNQLITQKGATAPDLSKKIGKISTHWQSLSGADFDKAYTKKMVADHKKVIKAFQNEAENGDDADVKNWASKTLPTLQDHLQMSQAAETKVTGSTP